MRVVLVKSCKAFTERQRVIEETWAPALRLYGVPVLFIEGGHERDELVENYIQVAHRDDKHGNRQKLRRALAVFLAMYPDAPRVFVCDDDTFVHPKRWLALQPTGEVECRLYYPKTNAHRSHPWVHGGPGFWLTRYAASAYVRRVTDEGAGDDVAVGELIQLCDLAVSDRPMLYPGDHYSGHDERIGIDNDFVTMHPCLPERMRTLFETTRDL
jgi:hypothetical protein